MSCFDRVYIKCPKCGTLIEFQSKAGDCELETYYEHSVPAKIALDIENSVQTCTNCKTDVVALPIIPLSTIAMQGVGLGEYTGWDKPDEDFE